MTLQTFEQVLSEVQLEKGLNYFENGYVIELEEWETGKWNAVVSGSEDYEVRIQFKKDTISKCSCECPHDVDYCKHIVAVLYDIQEKEIFPQDKTIGKGKKSVKNVPTKPKKIIISDVVNSIPEKDLRSFIIEHAGTDQEFRNILIAHFSSSFTEEHTHLYAEVIKNAARIAGGRHGFIDYHNVNKAIQPVYTLLQKAEAALEQGHFSVTADIAFAVIANVHDMMTNMDDSSGSAGDCIKEGFDLLIKLCEKDIPFNLKERIFKKAEIEAKDKKYDYAGFDEYWLEILVYAAYDREKEQRLLQVIDTMLLSLNAKADDWMEEYNTKRLLKHKMILLQRMGQNAEADALRLRSLHISDFRMELIEEALQKKDYANARQLITEGIAIAKKKEDPGTIESYKIILLRIAGECKDIDGIRTIAKELYAGWKMEYYRIIKRTYTTNEWPVIATGFIKELQQKDKTISGFRGTLNAERLASIFVEEGYWDRLLELLQNNPRLDFVESHSGLLTDKFPNELLAVYKETLIDYAAQYTGRSHYVTIRQVLKKIQGWNGGKDMVKQLIDQFIHQYKARKAMIEELTKLVK
jgi:hypothetical protein